MFTAPAQLNKVSLSPAAASSHEMAENEGAEVLPETLRSGLMASFVLWRFSAD